MEHQTISFLSSFNLYLMIHEAAHQWFGNCVSAGSWQDIWLHEGFATYCEGLCTEAGLGEGRDFSAWRKRRIFAACSFEHGSVFVADTTDQSSLFNTCLTYDKGAMILHMLRGELGDQLFFNALRIYITRYKFNNATPADFLNIVNLVSERNFDWFFDQWYYGAGFPVNSVDWEQNDGLLNIRIRQHTSDSSVNFFRLKVPILVCGFSGERLLVKFNYYQPSSCFTVDPGFEVSYLVFDPYGDLVSRTGDVDRRQVTVKRPLLIDYNARNKQLRARVVDSDSFDYYSLHKINTSEGVSGRISKNGVIELNTSGLPSGRYILALSGALYMAREIYIR